eukprot:2981699-Ditylum_brightwellii.AAC.1
MDCAIDQKGLDLYSQHDSCAQSPHTFDTMDCANNQKGFDLWSQHNSCAHSTHAFDMMAYTDWTCALTPHTLSPIQWTTLSLPAPSPHNSATFDENRVLPTT